MFWGQNLFELFSRGSFVMWPLLICSVIGLGIILERSWYFLHLRFNYQAFVDGLTDKLRARDLKGALTFSKEHANPVPKIASLYLQNLKNDGLRDDILKREGSFALEKAENHLRLLATITHLSPFLGLLGTVAGLVSAFHQIELLGGQVQPSDLAGGIWQALITTVFGLVIAIPCMAAYHGFENETDRISKRMQFLISELNEFFGKHSKSEFKSADIEEEEEKNKIV